MCKANFTVIEEAEAYHVVELGLVLGWITCLEAILLVLHVQQKERDKQDCTVQSRLSDQCQRANTSGKTSKIIQCRQEKEQKALASRHVKQDELSTMLLAHKKDSRQENLRETMWTVPFIECKVYYFSSQTTFAQELKHEAFCISRWSHGIRK